MPIYEYRCTSCGHITDIVHGINDPGPAFCPSCGAEATMRKQFAAPAIHYKGSGWARKDRGGSGGGAKSQTASATKGPTADAEAAAASSPSASGEGASTKSDKPAKGSAAASAGSGE